MRRFAAALPWALFVVLAGWSPAQGRTSGAERLLACDPSLPGGCEVSCVAAAGQTLFVLPDVRSALVTEFAGSHTLVELERKAPGGGVSLLVGDVSQCSLRRLQDQGLRQPPDSGSPPAPAPAPAAPPPAPGGSGTSGEKSGGGGALTWAPLVLLGLVRWRAVRRADLRRTGR